MFDWMINSLFKLPINNIHNYVRKAAAFISCFNVKSVNEENISKIRFSFLPHMTTIVCHCGGGGGGILKMQTVLETEMTHTLCTDPKHIKHMVIKLLMLMLTLFTV